MKKIKEFKPLWNLIKEDKFKIIIASVLIFIVELANTLSGYLNGQVVASGKHSELLKNSKIYKKLYETESLNS